jgi:hypothetical protein
MTILPSQELVQSVIDECQRHPEKLGAAPTPIAPEVLEKLTFPDGKPLPPSLKQWLAFDASRFGLFADLANLVITPTSLADWGGEDFNTMQRLLFPENLYSLYPDPNSELMWFLYTGQADEEGEYPIFIANKEYNYSFVELFAPNFALWLAIENKIYDFNLYRLNFHDPRSLFAHPDYGVAMRKQSARNFQGCRSCWTDGEAIAVNGTTIRWCNEDEIIVDLRKQGFNDEIINLITRKNIRGLH